MQFGTPFKFDHSMGPRNAPGPGSYDLGSSLGKQVKVVVATLPSSDLLLPVSKLPACMGVVGIGQQGL